MILLDEKLIINLLFSFNSGQPCSESASVLKNQANILNKGDIVNCNPFKVTGSGEANTETSIIDESDN